MKTPTPNIKADYLSGADLIRPFINYPLNKLDFKEVVADKSKDDVDRALLQKVLKDQYQGFEPSEKTQRNLDILDKENTFTVTTGHQLVLFAGPLYTTYKVLSTVKLAEHITKEVDNVEVVPVFWIHTEDHDFEEINHYYSSFSQKNTYPGEFQSLVGNHVLTEEIESVIPSQFEGKLKEAYKAGISMKEAYRRFVFELFDAYGVLILDASDERLKARFQRVLKLELGQSRSFTEINKTSTQLAGLGYPLQINPREINLFYMDDSGRDRIVAENGHYEVLNRDLTFQPDEMEKLIQENPDRFSPNVSLRPLYQEMILPNLAYFGGWGEIRYWVQLKGAFDAFGVNFPCVLPRMSATFATAAQEARLKELGLSLEDMLKTNQELYKLRTAEQWDSTQFEELQANILQQIEAYKGHIEGEISETLARSAEALKVKSQKYLKNMRKKAERVIRHKYPKAYKEIDQLKSEIQPDGWVQERILSLASLEGIMDPKDFVEFAYQQCDPLNFDHQFWILG
ncbi:MAG: bacillithiol biosynthesis cysteine-adding enzyme BshC [Bacteroidota bacterium]